MPPAGTLPSTPSTSGHRPFRDLRQRFGEDHAALLQAVHDEVVVHDLMQHVDRGGSGFQHRFDRVEGAPDSRTHAVGPGDEDFSLIVHLFSIARNGNFFKLK